VPERFHTFRLREAYSVSLREVRLPRRFEGRMSPASG
jgi:hypothetical protein